MGVLAGFMLFAPLMVLEPRVWLSLTAVGIFSAILCTALAPRLLVGTDEGSRSYSLARRLMRWNLGLIAIETVLGIISVGALWIGKLTSTSMTGPAANSAFVAGLIMPFVFLTYGAGVVAFVRAAWTREGLATTPARVLVWAWCSVPVSVALWFTAAWLGRGMYFTGGW